MVARLQDLIAQALGSESTELARIYVGEAALAKIAETAEILAEAQLKRGSSPNPINDAEFRRAFAEQFKLLLALACGGDSSSPKTKE